MKTFLATTVAAVALVVLPASAASAADDSYRSERPASWSWKPDGPPIRSWSWQ